MKKVVFLEGLPFILTILADQLSKFWAANYLDTMSWGALHFQATFNHGVFLGYLSHIPSSTKIVVLSTLGAFIICAYVFARLIIPMRSKSLKTGLAFLTSGILGNVIDRMTGNGGVVDFIYIYSGDWISPIWNIADMLQLVGHGLIMFGVFQDSKHFWNNQELRKNFWVDSNFQSRFCVNYIAVALGMGLMNSVMSYAFLKTTLDSLVIDANQIDEMMYSYLIATLALQTCLFLAVAYVSRILSAKIAGPLFAVRRFLTESLKGKKTVFKLREHDEFKELEPLLNEVASKMEVDVKKTTLYIVDEKKAS